MRQHGQQSPGVSGTNPSRRCTEGTQHVIDQLREMIHLATDVVKGKVEEVSEVLVLPDTEGPCPTSSTGTCRPKPRRTP